MDTTKRWLLRGGEMENSIAWAMSGFQGDRNARLAIASALATRQLEINFPDIIPADNVWQFDALIHKANSVEIEGKIISIYAEGFRQLGKSRGEVPDFLILGIGLMRSPLLSFDMKMNQAPLLSQAARLAFGNDIPVVFCNNAQRTWDDIIIHPHYDVIVAPSYLPKTEDPRIIECFGIPHLVSQSTINNGMKKWEDRLAVFRDAEHVIAVLLGGPMWKNNSSTENIPFTEEQAREFGRQIRHFALEKNAELLITNSHRTPPEASRAFMSQVAGLRTFFYDWEKDGADGNPYFAFLGLAHTIVATGDSISMQFEAASTGKPLYIALPQGNSYPEQRSAMNTLISANFARSFNGKWQEWEIPPFPNYIQDTASKIREKLIAGVSSRVNKKREFIGLLNQVGP